MKNELETLLVEIDDIQSKLKKYSVRIEKGLSNGKPDWDAVVTSIELMNEFNEKTNQAIEMM